MTPALIVVAGALWQEAYPGPLHVLAGEAAIAHPTLWLEAPVWQALKAPGLGPRIRRSLRLDLPRERYVDERRALDVLTPPLIPPGNAFGDVLLNQTVRWILKGKKLSPRVLWVARRGPAGSALARGLRPDVVVDFHEEPGGEWLPEADLVFWPDDAPLPAGCEGDPRLFRYRAGVRGALALWPMLASWLDGPIPLGTAREAARRTS